ncbi:MAG TPA: patatin-like phospholipase family protein [Acidimicrobiales bacterium]|nr:patatin-like phospholipase family protein [Acidimicrobiales bacterium]
MTQRTKVQAPAETEATDTGTGVNALLVPCAIGHPSTDPLPTFVLSGGGNLGALQVGMLYALVERGIRPGMIVGTSVGAINGAFLASRSDLLGIREIARLWSSLRRRDVLGVNVTTLIGGLLGRRGHLFDAVPIRQLLESFLDFRELEEAPVPLAVVATALADGEPVVLDSGDATTALLASSAVPGILPAVEIDGRMLVDGAAAADTPVREAVSLGARNLYVLPTVPLQVARLVAQLSSDGHGDRAALPTVRILPPPDLHIPLGDLGQSRRLLELGYDQARAWLDARPLPSPPRCLANDEGRAVPEAGRSTMPRRPARAPVCPRAMHS